MIQTEVLTPNPIKRKSKSENLKMYVVQIDKTENKKFARSVKEKAKNQIPTYRLQN